MTILFLCVANMHRSAMAEAILRSLATRDGRDDLEAVSAGTHAVAGCEAISEAVELARAAGLDLSGHRSRAATHELLSRADRILAMERSQRDWVEQRYPEMMERLRLLSHHAGPASGVEPEGDIRDAVGEGLEAFQVCYATIRDCVEKLYRDLPPAPQEVYARCVEERLRRARGAWLTLSPADYDHLDRWWHRRIPLWLILEAIDAQLDRQLRQSEGRRPRRLAHFAEEIEGQFEAYARSLASRNETSRQTVSGPDENSTDLIRVAATRLESAASAALSKGQTEAADLFTAAGDRMRARIEEALEPAAARLLMHSLERELLEELRRHTEPAWLDALRAETISALEEHRERMTPPAFETTVQRVVGERLRDIYGVPLLTDL